MGLFEWLKGKAGSRNGNPARSSWHDDWRAACAAPTVEGIASLEAALAALGIPDEEAEIEREMLDGLSQLTTLRETVSSGALPTIDTGHRVVGTDTCHFTAPSSMPDEPSQPGGQLILTSARAIFVGGGKAISVPWHAVAEVADQNRDVLLVRHDRTTFHRFRCNIYADVLAATFLARHLAGRPRRPGASV
jgi:hypothetical protein